MKSKILDAILIITKNFNTTIKIKFLFLILFSIIGSFLEAVSIALVIPLVQLLLFPSQFGNNFFDILNNIKFFQIYDLEYLVSFIFILFVILSVFFRTFLLWFSINLSISISSFLSKNIFLMSFNQSYEDILSIKNDKITNTVVHSINHTAAFFLTLQNIITASILCIGIIVSLLVFNTEYFSFFLVAVFFIYFTLIITLKKKLSKNSFVIKNQNTNVIEILRSTIGSIRNLIIDKNLSIYFKDFQKSFENVRVKNGQNSFLSSFPRFFVEGILIITLILLFLRNRESAEISANIANISALVFGIQKIMPLINQIYVGLSTMSGNLGSIYDIHKAYLKSNNKKIKGINYQESKIKFNGNINIKNLSFKYKNQNDFVLVNVNMSFRKSEKVAIIGKSGSGKSTLLDLIMGLLKPSKGEIFFDNKKLDNNLINSYYENIAHVPQEIFIINKNTAQNIAFNLKDTIAEKAELLDLSKKLDLNDFLSKENLGNQGSFLSGGQKQRIGIARALFKKPNILFLDEPTNAQDPITEEKINNLIYRNNNITVFTITHSIKGKEKYFDSIYEIKNREVIKIK